MWSSERESVFKKIRGETHLWVKHRRIVLFKKIASEIFTRIVFRVCAILNYFLCLVLSVVIKWTWKFFQNNNYVGETHLWVKQKRIFLQNICFRDFYAHCFQRIFYFSVFLCLVPSVVIKWRLKCFEKKYYLSVWNAFVSET